LFARVYWLGVDVPVWTWMSAAEWGVSAGVRVDGLSASVLAMVSLVGALIHVYAAGYMKDDPGFSRFFLIFHLFYLAMIGLLLSNNYVQLYLFWELVGACSYLLIGFWWHKKTARAAALQAFMTNRVGDFGLMLAVLVLLSLTGRSTRFAMFFPLISVADPGRLALAGLLIFWAACAKSAQFPLYFWLPDAMSPTPSASHAATMVTAGIFLLVRSWPLISAIGNLPEMIGWVGAFTALGAALIAGMKTDLKRILAYSTVSHLGLMAFALGMQEVGPAVFHLITHGFFKAVLFLCAGNIAHGLGKTTVSVSETGGLAKRMPLTFLCFSVAALSLAGVWPCAGFYSKDAILDAALRAGGPRAVVGLAIGAASAFYIFRMLFLAFLGPRPAQSGPGHAHEAEPVMMVPVLFLALGALGVGWLRGGFVRVLLSGWPPHPGPAALPEFPWGVYGPARERPPWEPVPRSLRRRPFPIGIGGGAGAIPASRRPWTAISDGGGSSSFSLRAFAAALTAWAARGTRGSGTAGSRGRPISPAPPERPPGPWPPAASTTIFGGCSPGPPSSWGPCSDEGRSHRRLGLAPHRRAPLPIVGAQPGGFPAGGAPLLRPGLGARRRLRPAGAGARRDRRGGAGLGLRYPLFTFPDGLSWPFACSRPS
jgi:formate hydrogenlyase subunit 3/multisubunit Na+/H+ antiporter MnhD subunit